MLNRDASSRGLSVGRASRQEWPAAGVEAGQEKPPGLRWWQEGCSDALPTRAWPLSSGGPAWPSASSCCLVPAENQGDKTEPGFKRDTKWSLHRALQQSGPIQTDALTQGGGLEKRNVQYPSCARMLCLGLPWWRSG